MADGVFGIPFNLDHLAVFYEGKTTASSVTAAAMRPYLFYLFHWLSSEHQRSHELH
jgi:hypothetical protein